MKTLHKTVATRTDRQELMGFARLMLAISLFTLGVIVFGSAVRATDSGMGCPDWPLCYDQLVPSSFDSQVFYEWFHRLIGGILAILFAIALVRVFRRPILRRSFGAQLVVGGILLAIQIVLGGLTVLQLLDPKVVSAHLINATLFYGLLIWTTFKAWALARGYEAKPAPKALQVGSSLFLVLIFAQILLGGMVSTNYAGLSCLEFPQCGDQWWPTDDFAAHVHMTHRTMGAVVFIASLTLVALGWIAHRKALIPNVTMRTLWLLPLLVVLQIGLGVVNVYWQLPDWASVLHLGIAQLIFTTALISTVLVRLHGRSFTQPVVDTNRRKPSLADPSFVAGT